MLLAYVYKIDARSGDLPLFDLVGDNMFYRMLPQLPPPFTIRGYLVYPYGQPAHSHALVGSIFYDLFIPSNRVWKILPWPIHP